MPMPTPLTKQGAEVGECLNPDRREVVQRRVIAWVLVFEQLAAIPALDEQGYVAFEGLDGGMLKVGSC